MRFGADALRRQLVITVFLKHIDQQVDVESGRIEIIICERYLGDALQ